MAAPCVRFGYASANARGWSIGGQNPNLRTGVIHGGRSADWYDYDTIPEQCAAAADYATILGYCEGDFINTAAPKPTKRAGCAIQIVPLIHVAALIERAADTRATVIGRVIRRLVPLVFSRYPERRSQARIRVGGVDGLASVGGVDWDCLDDSRRSRRRHNRRIA